MLDEKDCIASVKGLCLDFADCGDLRVVVGFRLGISSHQSRCQYFSESCGILQILNNFCSFHLASKFSVLLITGCCCDLIYCLCRFILYFFFSVLIYFFFLYSYFKVEVLNFQNE